MVHNLQYYKIDQPPRRYGGVALELAFRARQPGSPAAQTRTPPALLQGPGTMDWGNRTPKQLGYEIGTTLIIISKEQPQSDPRRHLSFPTDKSEDYTPTPTQSDSEDNPKDRIARSRTSSTNRERVSGRADSDLPPAEPKPTSSPLLTFWDMTQDGLTPTYHGLTRTTLLQSRRFFTNRAMLQDGPTRKAYALPARPSSSPAASLRTRTRCKMDQLGHDATGPSRPLPRPAASLRTGPWREDAPTWIR